MSPATPPVFLHIGAMKSGTTFLQSLLSTNRRQLAAAGYLFPGPTWGHQVRAVEDLLGLTRKPFTRTGTGAWESVVAEMLAHRGEASILSMEFLSFADARDARKAISSLLGAEVHVVVTVRDAVATIPSLWQTAVRTGVTTTWPEFRRGARRAAHSPRTARYSWDGSARYFARREDLAAVLRAWGTGVPPARLHVVTVPPPGSGPMLLWQRFARAARIPADVCSQPPQRSNESLGYASTELLRRVNHHLRRLPQQDYDAVVKEHLATRTLGARTEREERAALDGATYDAALRWNAVVRAAVLDAGVEVIGDLADLPVDPSPATVDRVRENQHAPTTDQLLAAALAGLDGMQRTIGRQRRRLARRGLPEPALALPRAQPDRWVDSHDPVESAARDLARLCRAAVTLDRRLRAASGVPA